MSKNCHRTKAEITLSKCFVLRKETKRNLQDDVINFTTTDPPRSNSVDKFSLLINNENSKYLTFH